MTAFEQAWGVVKMPMYHGTSKEAYEKIMREGLRPTETVDYDEADEDPDQIDDFDTRYVWAHGDKGYPHPHVLGPGGKPSAIFQSLRYSGDNPSLRDLRNLNIPDNAAVLEISDDAPGFALPPIVGGRRHQAGRDVRISPETISPEFIRRVSDDEILSALREYNAFRQAEEERRRMVQGLFSSVKEPQDREDFERMMYGPTKDSKGGYLDYKDDHYADVAKPYWPVSQEQKRRWSEYPLITDYRELVG